MNPTSSGFSPRSGDRKVDRVPNFEALIEDQHVEKLLGRFAGNTLSLGSDPAKGVRKEKARGP